MNHSNPHDHHARGNGTFGWILAGLIGIALFFLLSEHRAHTLGVLPYVLLLACPLMHVFMHRGHGDHGHHDEGTTSDIGHAHADGTRRKTGGPR